jgi:hypothetical protein
VLVDSSTTSFTIESAMVGPFFNNISPSKLKDEQQGIYLGNGDQDNYVFVGITPNMGNPAMVVIKENSGAISSTLYPINGLLNGTLTVYLDVNPATGTVQPKYKKVGDSVYTVLGPLINLSGKLLQTVRGPEAVAIGIAASSRSGKSFSATWDYINVYYNTTVTPKFSLRINTGGDSLTNKGEYWIADQYYVNVSPS